MNLLIEKNVDVDFIIQKLSMAYTNR